MAAITFEDVVKLAEQLSPEERQALIEHLQMSGKRRAKRPSEVLQVFEVNAWGDAWTLRREDEYGDEER